MALTINETYTSGLKKEIVRALAPVFQAAPVKEALGGRQVNVTWEYPREQTVYPTIYVTFSEGPVQNVGIGYYAKDTNPDATTLEYMQSRFEGTLNFNILARTQDDRDTIAAALVSIIQHGKRVADYKPFHDEISDNDYIMIHLITDYITPGGQNTYDAPWSADEKIFAASYSVQLFGEFFSDAYDAQLIQISAISLYPYRAGEPAPW